MPFGILDKKMSKFQKNRSFDEKCNKMIKKLETIAEKRRLDNIEEIKKTAKLNAINDMLKESDRVWREEYRIKMDKVKTVKPKKMIIDDPFTRDINEKIAQLEKEKMRIQNDINMLLDLRDS